MWQGQETKIVEVTFCALNFNYRFPHREPTLSQIWIASKQWSHKPKMLTIKKFIEHTLSENSIFTSIIFYDLYNHTIRSFPSSKKVGNGSLERSYSYFKLLSDPCIQNGFLVKKFILYSESYCKMNSVIQLNSHLKNRNISGNSSLALMQINKITMLKLHLISCCIHCMLATATAKLYIYNDKTMKLICFHLYQQKTK